MEFKNAILQAADQTFSMLGMSLTYKLSTYQSSLTSASQVNAIIGFTEGVKGNMMLEMSKETALKIASIMMGGFDLEALDELSVSAIAELCNMIVGNAFTLCDNNQLINFSPPSVFIGDQVSLMMSRIKTEKLHFEVEGMPIYLLISMEN